MAKKLLTKAQKKRYAKWIAAAVAALAALIAMCKVLADFINSI